MALNDLFAVKMSYLNQSKVVSINLAYKATFAEAVIGQARSLARAIGADIQPVLLDALSVDIEMQEIYVLGVNPAGRIPAYQPSNENNGTVLGQAYPNDSPYVISLKTNAPNSKHNGRVYISGISENDVEDQVLSAAYVAGDGEALRLALESDVVDPDSASRIYSPVVLNRMVNGVPVSPPEGYDVTLAILRTTIVSQRRRATPMREIGNPPI